MKFVFSIFLFLHGLIHLMGFLKAFGLAEIPQLSQRFSKAEGIGWLVVAVGFSIAAILLLLKNNLWLWIAIAMVLISQVLIVLNWHDAKFGTIANLIVLIVSVVAIASWNFKNEFQSDVAHSLKNTNISEEIISEDDLAHLPLSIQNYLKSVGAIGKPKVKSAKAIFKGKMREKGKDWFDFTSEQFNFFEEPARLFFMKANFKGLPTRGYHRYKEGRAGMRIKLLSLVPVVDHHEPEMFKTETVTFFNDMCLFAPAALIDARVEWQKVDDFSVKAVFHNGETFISALLLFDERGQLINFVSEDRVDVNSGQKVPFSTPIREYGTLNGYRLPIAADAVWHFPEGDFVYGKFYLQDVEYNIKKLDSP